MEVRDIMEPDVLTLDAIDTLDLADDLMRLGRIRHMPVLRDGSLVGILSQRDLFRAGLSSVLRVRRETEREWLEKIPIEQVMTTPVFSVAPHDSIRTVVALMVDKRIGCVPVLDGGKLVGLVSESDCLRFMGRLLEIGDQRAQLPELAPGT